MATPPHQGVAKTAIVELKGNVRGQRRHSEDTELAGVEGLASTTSTTTTDRRPSHVPAADHTVPRATWRARSEFIRRSRPHPVASTSGNCHRDGIMPQQRWRSVPPDHHRIRRVLLDGGLSGREALATVLAEPLFFVLGASTVLCVNATAGDSVRRHGAPKSQDIANSKDDPCEGGDKEAQRGARPDDRGSAWAIYDRERNARCAQIRLSGEATRQRADDRRRGDLNNTCGAAAGVHLDDRGTREGAHRDPANGFAPNSA